MRSWGIQTKIMIPSLITAVVMVAGMTFYVFPILERSIMQEKQDATRHVVELASGLLSSYEEQVRSGTLSLEEAQKSAASRIGQLRYEGNEYIWINDMHPRMVMHPTKPQLNGTDLTENKDPNGKHLFVEMAKVCKEHGEGFVDYEWPKPGSTVPSPKLSYVKLYQPWGWVVGTGVYIDDVHQQVGAIKRTLLVGLFALIAFSLFLTMISVRFMVTRRVHQAIQIADSLAEGNLRVAIHPQTNDEVGKLLRAMDLIAEKVTPTLREIRSASMQMEQSSLEVSEISREIEGASRAQQERAADVTKATGDLRLSSESVRELAESVRASSTATEKEAEQGLQSIRDNRTQVQQTLDEVSSAAQRTSALQTVGEKIHHIVDSIGEISEQTHLLALNATIEAARAGEQGRGFAVVAEEVGKLASRTAQETAQISQIISEFTGQVLDSVNAMKQVVKRVQEGASNTQQTAAVIERMAASVRESVAVTIRISEAGQSQMERLQQLQATLDSLFATIRDSGSKVGITSTISSDLNLVSQKILELMSNFSFDTETIITPDAHELRRHPRAQNGLLVMVCDESNNTLAEGITADFSVSGLQLRLPANSNVPASDSWMLRIMTPHKSLEDYERQRPLQVRSRVIWQRRDGLNVVYGLQFESLSAQEKTRLEESVQYFGKNPHFLNALSTSGTDAGAGLQPAGEGTHLREKGAAAGSG